MAKIILFVLLLNSILLPQQIMKEWETYFEQSNFFSTPNYEESIDYFKRLADVSPFVKMISIGKSPQGRDIYFLIVSKEKAFTPRQAKNTPKPILLILNGIHSGEIEGKDACMLLLREILITKEKQKMLDDIILLIIPIFNVDGHERNSPYNRINQNGPTEMGWRTTAQNLNLNRDFMKADTPEMSALLKIFSQWLPDFFIDTHTTNGQDFQYTISYGIEKNNNVPPKTRYWIRNIFIPAVEKETEENRFKIFPYVGFREGDLRKGLVDWVSAPRFSHGYAAIQNRPGLLIETHMLKPYKERVFSTKVLITAAINLISERKKELLQLNREADEFVVDYYFKNKNSFPLTFTLNEKHSFLKYKGIEEVQEESWITGRKITRYTGKPYEIEVPYFSQAETKDSVKAPIAYIIPKEYSNIVDLLKLHGVKVEIVDREKKVFVEKIKFKNVKFPSYPYEGRFLPQYEFETFIDSVKVATGAFYVPTNQRTLGVIIHLLEPLGPDSFVKWGFFNSIFEQKEYYEEYSMEPIASKMAEDNPNLKEEFLKKVEEDEKFRNSARLRLDFFYQRSPYFDKQLNVYPVMRVIE